MIYVSQADLQDNKTPWIKEMEALGIVTPPKKKGIVEEDPDRLAMVCFDERLKKAAIKEGFVVNLEPGKEGGYEGVQRPCSSRYRGRQWNWSRNGQVLH